MAKPVLAGTRLVRQFPGIVLYVGGTFAPFPPLSLREREQRAPLSESPQVWSVLRVERGSPSPQGLPKGEGRGEGKQTTARRSGNVFDMSGGRWPQGYLVSSCSF